MMSLAVTPGSSLPLSVICMASGTRSHSSPVAHSAAISVRPTPMPNAPSQPKWVVWLSEPKIVSTGQHQRFLADDLMADAAPDLEEMLDAPAAAPTRGFRRDFARAAVVGAGTAWSSVTTTRSGCTIPGAPICSKIRRIAAVLSWLKHHVGAHVEHIARRAPDRRLPPAPELFRQR